MRNNIYKNNTALKHLLYKCQKEHLQKSGVYKIGFVGTNNFYIGSTTESFNLRFLRHIMNLQKNKHYNKMLQRAFLKYEKIYLEILEVCEPLNCIQREQYFIDLYSPKYNICKKAGNTFGVKPSQKTLEKVSKKVDMFDLKGKFLKTFASRMEVFRETGICASCVGQAIKKKGVASNFQFRNHGEFDKLPKYENPLSYKLLVYNKFGEFVRTYKSILEAGKDLNIPVGNICKHLKNETKKCYGYIFKRYYNNFPLKIEKYEKSHKFQKKVKVTELKTNKEFIFNSLRTVDPSIMTRCSILERRKKEGDIFYIKDKYKVEIITCNSNEVAET